NLLVFQRFDDDVEVGHRKRSSRNLKNIRPQVGDLLFDIDVRARTMVITVIRVATPIVSPSMVSDARNLCARRALRHSAKLSRTASMGAEQFSRYFTESC